MSKRLIGLLAAGLLIGAACGGSSSTSKPTDNKATCTLTTASTTDLNEALFNSNCKPGEGKKGGTLVMGEWQAATQLNPFYTQTFADFEAIQPLLRGFLTITSDGKYVPDLAESVPTLDNGGVVVSGQTMTVVVKLKAGLKWSDGEPLTGNDFKYTWKWATDPAQIGCTGCTTGWPSIDDVAVSADGLTVTIHFKELYASWLGFLTGAQTILPEHYMKNIPIADAATTSMPVSMNAARVPWSGPFKVSAAGPTEIDYVPNPFWAAGVSTKHAPYLDGLKFQFFTDKDGMIAAFKTGEIDLAFDMTQADASKVKSVDPSKGYGEVQPAWQYEHFDFNQQSKNAPFLADVNVRKALAMTIDKQAIIDAVFPGSGITPACSSVPPGLWYRTEVTCPKFDVSGAKKLLDTAGLTVGSDGNRQYQGKTIDLLLATTPGNPTRLTELQKLQGFLQTVNIKSHIVTAAEIFDSWADTMANPTKEGLLYRGTYDIADFAWVIGGSPYSDNWPIYDSSQWPEKGDNSGSNSTRASSADMDAALAILKTAVDPKQQLTAMIAVQKALADNVIEVPLYYRAETTGVGVHVGNWPGYNPSSIGPTWDVEDWYYK